MTLYVVATPVGNLEDVSRRAVRVLGEVDVVLAEDTRTSRVLMDALGLAARLRAYHDHSDDAVRAGIVAELAEGGSAALITDAGTPCVSDPGYALVRDCAAAGVDVVPVPGASSVTIFLSAAGLPTDRFQFVGFAPRKPQARADACADWLAYGGTTVVLESPKRVIALLDALREHDAGRQVVVGRELTKMHEEFVRGTVTSVRDDLAGRDRVRGEIVLGIAPASSAPTADEAEVDAWAVDLLGEGLRTKSIARVLSRHLGVSAEDAYRRVLAIKDRG